MGESNKQDEWALKQYDLLMRTFTQESAFYWARSQHFLVADAALFAFVATTRFADVVQNPSWLQLLILSVVGGAGICLTTLWERALLAGEFWLDHWKDLIVEREEAAFGTSLVLREFTSARKRYSSKETAHLSARLFYVLWVALLAMLLVAAVAKLSP